MSISVIILAAGRSARLGSPKQLLEYKGRTLLEHAIDVAKPLGEVIVVTGAAPVDEHINDPDIVLLRNNQWEEGMGSSIRCGIRYVMDRGCEAAIIMVCDQPYVTTALLGKLLGLYKAEGKGIVASVYDERPGTPALFDRSVFERLLLLRGDKGAKQVIMDHKEIASFLPFPEGITDIDTPSDYEKLRRVNDDQG